MDPSTAAFWGALIGSGAIATVATTIATSLAFFGSGKRELKHWWRQRRFETLSELLAEVEARSDKLRAAADDLSKAESDSLSWRTLAARNGQLMLLDQPVQDAYFTWERTQQKAAQLILAALESGVSDFGLYLFENGGEGVEVIADITRHEVGLIRAVEKNLGLTKRGMRSDG